MNRTFNFFLATICCSSIFFASQATAQYTLTVESSDALYVPGNTVYRFYVNLTDASDKFSAVFGNDQDPLVINSPDGIFNSSFNASWSASGINPAFLGFFPDMAEDSYATVGLDGPAAGGSADPSLVEDNDLNPTISSYFVSGGTSLNVNSITGGSWYVLNTASNALPDADLRVLVMQITTTGSVSGTLNYQVFPLGVGTDQVQVSVDFDGAGTFGGAPVEDCAGVLDGDSTTDECGTCDNDPSNDCVQDCSGVWGGENVLDACGVCDGDGSSCADECGVPNGDNSSCADACGVPNGDNSCLGCVDSLACNYDSSATIEDGSCDYCSCGGEAVEGVAYTLTVESSAALHVPGNTVYRFYVNLTDASDKFSAVFGNDQDPLVINSPDGIFNSCI